MTYREFMTIANCVKACAVRETHTMTQDRWYDEDNNSYTVTDCGYTKMLVYKNRYYITDYENNVKEF